MFVLFIATTSTLEYDTVAATIDDPWQGRLIELIRNQIVEEIG